MKRHVYIARHGQSTWNAEGRWAGAADPPLTALGEEQARMAAAALRDFGFDVVQSSGLVRARRTAEIIANELGLPLGKSISGFNERDAGRLSGLTSAEIDVHFPGLLDTWRQAKVPVHPPGGEPWPAFLRRVVGAFARVEGRRSLMIAHAGVMRAVAEAVGEEPRRNGNLEGRWVSLLPDQTLAAGEPFASEENALSQ
jgi:2,3-bisphosphoglycerate-dependent phosphoglycerate mutase